MQPVTAHSHNCAFVEAYQYQRYTCLKLQNLHGLMNKAVTITLQCTIFSCSTTDHLDCYY